MLKRKTGDKAGFALQWKRPVDVSTSVRDATGAALKALQSCVS